VVESLDIDSIILETADLIRMVKEENEYGASSCEEEEVSANGATHSGEMEVIEDQDVRSTDTVVSATPGASISQDGMPFRLPRTDTVSDVKKSKLHLVKERKRGKKSVIK